MQAKIKSDDAYTNMHEDSNSLELLKVIKGIAYKFESQKNIYLALDDAKCAFYAYRQGADETNANYMAKFRNTIEVIEHFGRTIGEDRALMIEELKAAGRDASDASSKDIKTAIDTAKRKAHAMAFLKRADKGRYGLLITELENQFTRGTDQYPTNITEAYNLLVNYKKPATSRERHQRTPRDEHRRGHVGDRNTDTQQDKLTFVQREAEPPIEDIVCYNCQRKGHYASTCTFP